MSTGKSGSGYVRINANPNDLATPYIDIVERTGSGIYDNQLMVRLGDLTGLSSGLLFGNDNPGFGIFTQNGFFSGGITATTGSFTGVVHINTSDTVKMKLGTDVESTNDGIHINANNYFNAGVMFIDLEKWRKKSIESLSIEIIKEKNKELKFWDQDILNIIFNDDAVSYTHLTLPTKRIV